MRQRERERARKKAPLEKTFLWFKLNALSLFEDTNRFKHRQGTHTLFIRMACFFAERQLIGQHNNRKMCANISLIKWLCQRLFFQIKNVLGMGISFVLQASEHIQATWKGKFKGTYVPWWTSIRFDVQTITYLYPYQPETECFQFLNCKPSFFFFSSWYSEWTVKVWWCWTISMLYFPLISLTAYFKEGKLFYQVAVYCLITEWRSQAWKTFYCN